MPVWKYGSVEEMPDAWAIRRHVPFAERLRAIVALGSLIEPLQMPRGVRKFRSFDEAIAERERYERERIERIRARNDARNR